MPLIMLWKLVLKYCLRSKIRGLFNVYHGGRISVQYKSNNEVTHYVFWVANSARLKTNLLLPMKHTHGTRVCRRLPWMPPKMLLSSVRYRFLKSKADQAEMTCLFKFLACAFLQSLVAKRDPITRSLKPQLVTHQ